MDESSRDIYNRFGPSHLLFDPRKDEMKLISDLAVNYLFWAVMIYIITLPISRRVVRTWMGILGIVLVAVQVMLSLTETTLPEYSSYTFTEYEIIYYCHTLFPGITAALCLLAEYLYVDKDETTMAVLSDIYHQQKVNSTHYLL